MSATIKSAITEGAADLEQGGCRRPAERGQSAADARTRSRPHLPAGARRTSICRLNQFDQYQALVARRAGGYPLQYLTGHQEFFQLDFEVTPDVLIPRPETELIVEVGIEILKDKAAPCFADLGTGSGAIAISSASGIANGHAPLRLMFRLRLWRWRNETPNGTR